MANATQSSLQWLTLLKGWVPSLGKQYVYTKQGEQKEWIGILLILFPAVAKNIIFLGHAENNFFSLSQGMNG